MRTLILLTALILPALLDAQTVRRDAQLLATPSGRALATFRNDASVQAGAARSGAVQVTLQGYVHRSLIGAARDSFRISVNASGGALMRATPASNGRVVALLHNGMGLHEVNRRGEWVQVRRTGWVPAASVQRQRQARASETPARAQQQGAAAPPQRAPAQQGQTRTAAATQAQRPSPAPAARDGAANVVSQTRPGAEATDSAAGALDRDEREPPPPIVEDLMPTRRVELAAAPGGSAIGTVEPGARVATLARDRGWVRVRVEGWVPEDALAPADSALRASPSAADLRADPEAAKGKAVRWEVQVLAFQTADQLRRDMQPDEPYLLARGPAGENTILYLALPHTLVANARAIPSLSTVIVTGRVRVARSQPAGVPIIEVQSITRR